jgi:hypothetical protein
MLVKHSDGPCSFWQGQKWQISVERKQYLPPLQAQACGPSVAALSFAHLPEGHSLFSRKALTHARQLHKVNR